MGTVARDVMDTKFHLLSPETSIAEAVRLFKEAGEREGRRLFGMMVVDGEGSLAGTLSMYDILLVVRPKHIHIWGEMDDIDVTGLVDASCERVRSLLVGDIMTTDVTTITADTHLFMIVDIMLKKHIRRLPVVEDGKILGIVYISDVFYHLLDRFVA